MKYKTVLFDADGTLLDFLKSEDEAVREAMAKNGITPTDAMVHRYSEINLSLWKRLERGEIAKDVLLYHRFELFAEEFGFTLDAQKMAQDYMYSLSAKGYVLDGAKELLEKLKDKVEIYIVTNGVAFIQRERYVRSGLQDLILGVFISEEVGCEKPNLQYFEYVAKHIPNFDPEQTLIVGDSLTSDMRGGIDFGIDTCWYNPEQREVPSDMKLTFVASNFDEIYHYITCGRVDHA